MGIRKCIYQVYPLGFTGAPFENDGELRHGILRFIDWIPHIRKVGANAIYFHLYLNPIHMVTIQEITRK